MESINLSRNKWKLEYLHLLIFSFIAHIFLVVSIILSEKLPILQNLLYAAILTFTLPLFKLGTEYERLKMLFYIRYLFKNLKEKISFKAIDIKTAKASIIGGVLTGFLISGGIFGYIIYSIADVGGGMLFLMAGIYAGCIFVIGDYTRDRIKYLRSLIDSYLQENEKEFLQSFKLKRWNHFLSGFLSTIDLEKSITGPRAASGIDAADFIFSG